MQLISGIGTEMCCLFFLSTQDTSVDVIKSFVPLSIIAKIDDFYFSAIPNENRLKAIKSGPYEVKYERHNIMWKSRSNSNKFYRVIYKLIRMWYCSFHFYFFATLSLILPLTSMFVRN